MGCTPLRPMMGILTTAGLLACDPLAPGSSDAELIVRAGSNQADTVFSTLPDPLEVEVQRAGESAADLEVHFVSLPSDGGPRAAFIRDDSVQVHVIDTTDAAGRASVGVRLGARAGEATVIVEVPSLGVSRNVPFEILPGQPNTVVEFGPGGIVTLGGTAQFSARFQDAYGNDVNAPVLFASPSPALEVTEAGSAQGAAFGAAVLHLLHGARVVGEISIRVLPGREIVFTDTNGSLRHVATDSSLVAAVPGDGMGEYSWSPGGDTLVGTREGKIYFSDFENGGPSEPSGMFPGLSVEVRSPRFSPDGQWIYYSEADTEELRRVRIDGTDSEPLISSQGNVAGREPWPSPDGTRLVFRPPAATPDEDSPLRILDLQTGSVTDLGVSGTGPAWSPGGDWIAYRAWSGSELWDIRLIAPDGTPGPTLDVPFAVTRPDWSLGSTYLAYTTGHHWHEHVVVEVGSGVYVKLPGFPGTSGGTFQRLGVPAWRP